MIEISTPDSLAFGVITARFWFVDIHKTDGFILNTKIHVITSDFNATSVVATRTWYICHWMLLSKIDTIDGCVRAWCRPTNQSLTSSLVLIVLLFPPHIRRIIPGMQIWLLDKTATKCTCRRVLYTNFYQDSNKFLPSFLASGDTQSRA